VTGEALIRIEQVDKIYNPNRADAFHAVHQVSLAIEAGSVLVLKGPSGSGKTSLLSLIGAMTRPTSGRVFVRDREISRLPERFLTEVRRQTFGFVFQQFHLIRNLSVLENILLPGYPGPVGMRELSRRGMELLQSFDLADKVSRNIDQLSGGEQQRVAIARALINDPQILIADEPTAHLDRGLAIEFLDCLQSLHDQGRTIVMATHDPFVCEQPMVTRIASMLDGRLLGVE